MIVFPRCCHIHPGVAVNSCQLRLVSLGDPAMGTPTLSPGFLQPHCPGPLPHTWCQIFEVKTNCLFIFELSHQQELKTEQKLHTGL